MGKVDRSCFSLNSFRDIFLCQRPRQPSTEINSMSQVDMSLKVAGEQRLIKSRNVLAANDGLKGGRCGCHGRQVGRAGWHTLQNSFELA